MAGMSLGVPSGSMFGVNSNTGPNFSIGAMSRTPVPIQKPGVAPTYSTSTPTAAPRSSTNALNTFDNTGRAVNWDPFRQDYVPVASSAPKPAAPIGGGGAGAGGGSGYAGGSGPTNMGALPPQMAVPVNEGKIPEVSDATATGSAPGGGGGPAAGWNVVARGGLNDRLGTRIPRMSMNALSAGIY